MPVFLKEGRAVLFVHVPKTGGTSIERHFAANGWRMHYRDARTGAGSLNSYLRCSPQHMEAERLQQLFRLDRFDLVFCVVRDPVARFRSEYAMRNARDLRTDAPAVEAWGDRAFAAYARDPYTLDNHLRPQHEFLVPDTLVYRLESGLDAAVDDLNSRFDLGLTGGVPRHRDRSKASGVATRDIEVSDALDARLREFYAGDFERLGY